MKIKILALLCVAIAIGIPVARFRLQPELSLLLLPAALALGAVSLVTALVETRRKQTSNAMTLLATAVLPFLAFGLAPVDLEVRGARYLLQSAGPEKVLAEIQQIRLDFKDQFKEDRLHLSRRQLAPYPGLSRLAPAYVEIYPGGAEAKKFGFGDWAGFKMPDGDPNFLHSDTGVVKLSPGIYWYDPENKSLKSEL